MVNTVWAFAKLKLADVPLISATSRSLQTRLGRFNPRFLCNTAWALAALKVESFPLKTAIQEECLKKVKSFNAQDMANTLWAFATLLVSEKTFMEVMTDHASTVRGLTPQGLSNTMWAVAVLVFQSDLVEGLKPQLVRAAPRLNPQELSNVAWAFATLRICSGEVLTAVCDAGMTKLPEFVDMDMANIAWSLAAVTWHDPIVDAIAKLSMERLDRQLESENAVVNCLALVEALQTAGKLEDSYLDSVLKALLRRADAIDEEHLLQPPAELTIRLAELETNVVSEPRALSASLPELYALWKPPGWSAASESDEITTSTSQKPLALRTWLQENFGHRRITHDESVTYGLVHRLDRFTSGVLLWAPCYRGLYEARLQFAARKVQKEYLCLAAGVLKVPKMIKAPIAESSSQLGVARMYISPIGRSAFTEVLDSVTLVDPDGQLLSLCHIRLHTGRTHQIRVHMAHEGHPLVGDPVYGGITPSWCERHWLHAWKLGLQMTSAPVTVEVPVPMDLRRILERLQPADVGDAFRLRQWKLTGSN